MDRKGFIDFNTRLSPENSGKADSYARAIMILDEVLPYQNVIDLEELEANGSPRATIETDEERTYFLIDIPCHPYFAKKEIEIDTSGIKENVEIGVKDGVKGGVKELSNIQEVIVKDMLFYPSITTSKMAQKTGIKFRTLQRHISQLQAMGVVVRKDGRKDGYWEVVKNK